MDTREYIGNSKRITIDNNKIHLRIIGNDNKINLKNNSGHLDIIGNSTRVKIAENSGKVNYTGNSGKIYFGANSKMNSIKYNGNNGSMKMLNNEELWKNPTSFTPAKSSTFSSLASTSSPKPSDKFLSSSSSYNSNQKNLFS